MSEADENDLLWQSESDAEGDRVDLARWGPVDFVLRLVAKSGDIRAEVFFDELEAAEVAQKIGQELRRRTRERIKAAQEEKAP